MHISLFPLVLSLVLGLLEPPKDPKQEFFQLFPYQDWQYSDKLFAPPKFLLVLYPFGKDFLKSGSIATVLAVSCLNKSTTMPVEDSSVFDNSVVQWMEAHSVLTRESCTSPHPGCTLQFQTMADWSKSIKRSYHC